MTDDFSLTELLSRAIASDAGLTEILRDTQTSLRHEILPLASKGPDHWEVAMTVSTRQNVPTVTTLTRLEHRIRQIVADVEGPEAQLTVRMHVTCVG